MTSRVSILARLSRLSSLGRISLPRFSQALPLIRNPATFSRPARSFWGSANLRQRYQYVRFGDPPPGSGGPGGKGSGGGGQGKSSNPFESFWRRMSPGQKILIAGFGGGAPIFYVTHLETVEPTGRRRFIFMSRNMEEELGKATYKQIMRQFGSQLLPKGDSRVRMCERVVERLGPATGMEGVDWKVYVIDDPTPNAFVIPGGQIFVFSGILPIAQNEAGLATILGHEIAHYTLRHIAEKASLSQFFGIIGFFAAWMLGFPLDVLQNVQQVALDLPNSRACETEADYVGLLYMAKACYDPEEGPKVWQRMTQMAKGQPKIPRFLSTHPENKDRQQRLESHMDEAMQKGVEAGCGSGYGDITRRFRDGMW